MQIKYFQWFKVPRPASDVTRQKAGRCLVGGGHFYLDDSTHFGFEKYLFLGHEVHFSPMQNAQAPLNICQSPPRFVHKARSFHTLREIIVRT